jgi:plasmid stabilization system protein ParE
MKSFVLTPRAEQDLSDIWDYIAADNVKTANRVLDTLEKVIIRLAKNPGMGTNWREELADKRPSFSSRLFLLDRLPARNQAASDCPRSTCCPRRTEYSGPHAR